MADLGHLRREMRALREGRACTEAQSGVRQGVWLQWHRIAETAVQPGSFQLILCLD